MKTTSPSSTLKARVRIAGRVAAVLYAASIATACIPSAGGMPPWSIAMGGRPSSKQASAPAQTSKEVVVYLDASGSMVGYILPDIRSIYSRTVIALHERVAAEGGPASRLRKVGAQVTAVDDENREAAFERAALDRGFYDSGVTNLDAAFRSFDSEAAVEKPASSGDAGEKPRADTPEPPPELVILVTDGVESKVPGGTSPTTLRAHMAGLLEKGWGGSVIGVMSEFSGTIPSENRPGRKVSYVWTKDEPKYRPFYLFVFSPDRDRVEEFVQLLVKKIRGEIAKSEPKAPLDERVKPYFFSAPLAREAPDPSQTETSESLESAWQRTGRERKTEGLRYTVGLGRDESADFSVTVTRLPWSDAALASYTPKELADLLTWTTVEECPYRSTISDGDCSEHRHARVSIVGDPDVLDDGSVRINLRAEWERELGKDRSWAFSWLVATFDARRLEAAEVPNWVDAWTTVNDEETSEGGKTYEFRRTVSGFGRYASETDRAVARLLIRTGEQ